jgi:hypothetical protein
VVVWIGLTSLVFNHALTARLIVSGLIAGVGIAVLNEGIPPLRAPSRPVSRRQRKARL